MTFDIPFDQPLDVRSHGYINARDNCILSRHDFIQMYIIVKISTDGHHLVSVVRFELDQIIMALCRIFDVIKQLSTL